jgi:hypothetical protein
MTRAAKVAAYSCGGCLLVAAVAVLGVALWINHLFGAPKPPDPVVAAGTALRPAIFLTDGATIEAGTASAVRVKPGAAPILVTALHLFGTAGGYSRELSPPELKTQVKAILLTRIEGGEPVAAARTALRTTGPPLSDDDPNVGNDVAAFALLPRSQVVALELASKSARPGEWVWLVGDVYNHEPQQQRLFAGQVLVSGSGGTVVRFRQQFPLRGFSGAPVINAKKQVIGILISGGEPIGNLNPAETIRQRLKESGL